MLYGSRSPMGLRWGKGWLIVNYREYRPCAAAVRPFVKLFDHSCYISRESKTTRNELWSRASVCLYVRGRMPTLLHGPGCNLGEPGGVVVAAL